MDEKVILNIERLRDLFILYGIDTSDYIFQKKSIEIKLRPDNEFRIEIDHIGILKHIAYLIASNDLLDPESIIPFIIIKTTSPWASAIIQYKLLLEIEREKTKKEVLI